MLNMKVIQFLNRFRKILKRFGKKAFSKTKKIIILIQFIGSLNGIGNFSRSVGVSVISNSNTLDALVRNINSKNDFRKQIIITKIIDSTSSRIIFTPQELDELYKLYVNYEDNLINEEELINKVFNLRGGDFKDIAEAAFYALLCVWMLMGFGEADAFVPSPPLPPPLKFLYGDNKPGNIFGYGKGSGRQTIIFRDQTRNAGFDKKPYEGNYNLDYNYDKILKELESKLSKKNPTIIVGGQVYYLKNKSPFLDELEDACAQVCYDSIVSSQSDIEDISKNTGLSISSIKQVKEHVFINKHLMSKGYEEDLKTIMEYKKFNPDLRQALAWMRLKSNQHSGDDIQWFKHESYESQYELKNNATYEDSHAAAEKFYKGFPWTKD
jgi:hypothetical protein